MAKIDIFGGDLKKAGFSSPFDHLWESYRHLMGPTRDPEPHPDYFMDLMGGYNAKSLVLKITGGPPIKIGTGKPSHVGRVVEETHIELRRVWRDHVTISPDSPVLEMAERVKSDADVRRFLDTYQRFSIAMLANPSLDPVQNTPPGLNEMAGIYKPMVMDAFASIPVIELDVGPKDGRKRVVVPNRLISVQAGMPNNLSRGLLPAPLSGMLWAIDLASGGILRRREFGLMETFVGVQSSVTDHMKVVADAIDDAMGSESFYDLIHIRGKELGDVYQEEAHHVQIARAAAHIMGRYPGGFDAVLGKIGRSSRDVKLDKPQHVARDVAILLYATALGTREAMRIYARDSEFQKHFVPAAGPYRNSAEDMAAKLIEIADEVAKTRPGPGGMEMAIEMHFLTEERMGVLFDAINRAGILQQSADGNSQHSWQCKPADHPNAMMLIMRDALPGLWAEMQGHGRSEGGIPR